MAFHVVREVAEEVLFFGDRFIVGFHIAIVDVEADEVTVDSDRSLGAFFLVDDDLVLHCHHGTFIGTRSKRIVFDVIAVNADGLVRSIEGFVINTTEIVIIGVVIYDDGKVVASVEERFGEREGGPLVGSRGDGV